MKLSSIQKLAALLCLWTRTTSAFLLRPVDTTAARIAMCAWKNTIIFAHGWAPLLGRRTWSNFKYSMLCGWSTCSTFTFIWWLGILPPNTTTTKSDWNGMGTLQIAWFRRYIALGGASYAVQTLCDVEESWECLDWSQGTSCQGNTLVVVFFFFFATKL